MNNASVNAFNNHCSSHLISFILAIYFRTSNDGYWLDYGKDR